MSEVARVLNADDYATTAQPYTVERVAEAFLAELRRQREPKPEAAKADPQALKLREEAAELKAQASEALAKAQAKAKALVAEAEEKSRKDAVEAKQAAEAQGRVEGLASGRAEGEAQGRAEGLASYADSLARLQSLLEGAKTEKEAYFNDREALLAELAVRVAAKVIHREVESRPDHIMNLLRQAIQNLADKSKLQVHVHPDDFERLTRAQSDGLLNLRGVKQIEFLADDKVLAGGLRVSSGYQTLDAALDSQLAEICRGLLEEAYHERS